MQVRYHNIHKWILQLKNKSILLVPDRPDVEGPLEVKFYFTKSNQDENESKKDKIFEN